MEKITWQDLSASGTIVQDMFAAVFPEGLTEEEMENSDRGWVRRALARLKGTKKDG